MAETRTGGRIVADALVAHGIERAFCVPGESYLPLLDALYDRRDALSVITCRHEHGAGLMAEAEGKLTGRPGVCLVTRGPGACNAAIAVHTAFQDSTPMLLVVGQVKRAFRGREAFQEVDFRAMFSPLAKQVDEIVRADALPGAVAQAMHIAVSGRPGPVVLAVPQDVLAEPSAAVDAAVLPVDGGVPDPGLMERCHQALGDARRPMLIVGGSGWTAQARADLASFVAQNGLPVSASFRRNDIVDNAADGYVGELGVSPNPKLVARLREADLVLAIGTRLGEIVTQGYTLFGTDGPSLIHVHPDPAVLGRVFDTALAIPATVASFAAAARRLAPCPVQHWQGWTAAARRDYLEDRTPPASIRALDPAAVMAGLDRVLADDAIVSVDAGNFSGWPQRYLRFGAGRRLLGPCNGAMGYAVPAAIAAKLAFPERTVVACVGDGSFGMTGGELATAVRCGAPIVVLIGNNAMYGTIRTHQEQYYPKRVIATDLTNPDYVALARAHGAHGERVERTEDFADAFARACAAGRPAVIELVIDPDLLSSRLSLGALRARTGADPVG
jgi:acetolactate synthase-1/2/3 large subunit